MGPDTANPGVLEKIHCGACKLHLAHNCQSCKDNPNTQPNQQQSKLSDDHIAQNNAPLGQQHNPSNMSNNHTPQNNSPSLKDSPTPIPSFTTGQHSPSAPSSTSSQGSLSIMGTKASTLTSSESHIISGPTSSASPAKNSNTEPSVSATVAKPDTNNLATILGVVCGVLSFLLLCLAFWLFLRQRSRRRQRRHSKETWEWFHRHDKGKNIYSPSVKGAELRVESREHSWSGKTSRGTSGELTEGNLEILERHSSRTSVGSGKSSNSLPLVPSKRRDLRRVFSMGALTHTTGTTSKSALVIALPPESHPKQSSGPSPSSKILRLLRTYEPEQYHAPPGQINNIF